MRHKNTKQMLDYWMGLYWEAGNEAGESNFHSWPERSAIQPAECRSLLGNMFILQREDGKVDYRLAGTTLCSLFGRELKRSIFSESFVGHDQHSAESWTQRIGLDDYVVLMCSKGENSFGETVNLETLLLPLSHHGERGSRILGLTTPNETHTWLGNKPIISQNIRSVRILRPWENQTGPGFLHSFEQTAKQNSSRRIEIDAPEIFGIDPGEHLDASSIDQVAGPRKFGHLTVIDGGRS